jgi:outer membrane protein
MKFKSLSSSLYLLILFVVLSTLSGLYIYFSIPKIGYIRNKIVIERYEGMKEAKVKYDKKLEGWQIQADTLDQMLEGDIVKFEKEKSTLSAKERSYRENVLNDKIEGVRNYKTNLETKAGEEEQKLLQAAYSQINSFVKEYAEKNGYDIILGTTEEGNVMYGTDKKDITEEVLLLLNKKYKGE